MVQSFEFLAYQTTQKSEEVKHPGIQMGESGSDCFFK